MTKKYVIIGAGIAGLSAAKAIREVDLSGKIDIFTAENNLPYSRPMLTKAPFISFDPMRWTIYDEAWLESNGIQLHVGKKVTNIDVESKTIVVEGQRNARENESSKNDSTYMYDKLILATGAQSLRIPIPGADLPHVYTIRRAEDIINIKRAYKADTSVAVIGGGVIGLEAAVELARYGARVTVLEAMPYLMSRQIDEEISDLICHKLSNINIITDAHITEITVDRVIFDDESFLPCDFVVMSCGVKAETSIVPDGIDVPKSISINEHCQTSLDDIYAAGDCAEFNGLNYALWSQGMIQGEVAGKHAAGVLDASIIDNKNCIVNDPHSTRIDTSLVINSPELSLFVLGDMGKNPDLKYEIKYASSMDEPNTFFANPTQGEFFEKQYIVDGKVVGAALIGNLTRMQNLKDKIQKCNISRCIISEAEVTE